MSRIYEGTRKLPSKKEYMSNGYYKMPWTQNLKNLVNGIRIKGSIWMNGRPIEKEVPATLKVVNDRLEFDIPQEYLQKAHYSTSSRSYFSNPQSVKREQSLEGVYPAKLDSFLYRLNAAHDYHSEFNVSEACHYTYTVYDENDVVIRQFANSGDREKDKWVWQFVEPDIEEKIIKAYDEEFEKNFYKTTGNKKGYTTATLKSLGFDIDSASTPKWYHK